jgi:site-specific recombinase XerD
MTVTAYFSRAKILLQLRESPVGAYIDLYAARLTRDGYGKQSGCQSLRAVGAFNAWLATKALNIGCINEAAIVQYEADPCKPRHLKPGDKAALCRLLVILREVDAIAPPLPIVISPHAQIFAGFDRYLDRERGHTHGSIVRHLPVVRKFLNETCGDRLDDLARLRPADIIDFVERHAHDHSPDSAKGMCSTLRIFLRYLLWIDRTTLDLARCVPTVRRWRFVSLPTYLSSTQVQNVLDSCDRCTTLGRRDYAILIMLARLGLRANEVATLSLADLDWMDGRILIHSKNRQRAEMPLPADVGAALADYLQTARPRSDSRLVFLRDLAPHVGFASSAAVSMIAKTALKRAGLDGFAHLGAHLFRHSLATELLQAALR